MVVLVVKTIKIRKRVLSAHYHVQVCENWGKSDAGICMMPYISSEDTKTITSSHQMLLDHKISMFLTSEKIDIFKSL